MLNKYYHTPGGCFSIQELVEDVSNLESKAMLGVLIHILIRKELLTTKDFADILGISRANLEESEF